MCGTVKPGKGPTEQVKWWQTLINVVVFLIVCWLGLSACSPTTIRDAAMADHMKTHLVKCESGLTAFYFQSDTGKVLLGCSAARVKYHRMRHR